MYTLWVWKSQLAHKAWLLTTVNKDSFDSSRLGSFTTLTRLLHYCRLVCLHKKKRHWPSAVLENKKCDCVFRRERTEVNLANKVVSLIANMTKNPCCAVAFSIMAPLSFKRPRFSHGAAKREKRERVSSPTLPKPELEQKKNQTH